MGNKDFTIKNFTGKITLLTGLHIGGGDTEMHIGGVDNSVIKDPITNEPYIPGSSIKGKVRSLLEYYAGVHVKTNGKPLQAANVDQTKEIEKNIVLLFGSGGSDSNKAQFGVTRTVFSDAFLLADSKNNILSSYGKFTEVKAENSIDRLSGTAENPRFTERVVKGAEFNLNISIKIFSDDKEDQFINTLLKGLKLLTYDALGGSGSRGYGKIAITFDDKDIQDKFDQIIF